MSMMEHLSDLLFITLGVFTCRSVLAEAVFKDLVSMSPLNPFICVDSASIGPAVGKGLHDPRVMWAAQKAGLTLSRRNIRPFDEQVDIVNYDLVLTMDHFDHDEVGTVLSTMSVLHTSRKDVDM